MLFDDDDDTDGVVVSDTLHRQSNWALVPLLVVAGSRTCGLLARGAISS